MPDTAPAFETTFDAATLLREALPQVDAVIADASAALRGKVATGDRISNSALEGEQHTAHALAWIATYGECLREMSNWAERLSADGKFGEMESLLLQIGAGEYLAQLQGGLIMSQGEIARLSDVGVDADKLQTEAVNTLVAKSTLR